MQRTFLHLAWEDATHEGRLDTQTEILMGQIREHRETNIFPIRSSWLTHRQLFEEHSARLLFYDIETSYRKKPGKPYPWIFSICLMNGAQETILHAKVSQEMTVNQLYDKMDDKEWHAEVFKWHGVRSNEMTSGMTMREIADTLKDAGINEDFYSMEQSSGFYDHDGWYGNLEEIGMQRLIPKRTHVLRLIPAMRLAFSDFKLNHSLSFMHRLLCPEDRDLIARAHEEDADVRMLIKQAKIYFKGTRSPLQRSGIEIYLEGGQPKDSGEARSDNNGALMTPSTNETIKDLEEVILEGDGPEEAQDRDDGASPDDDWLEDDDWLKAARWHEAYDWLEDDQLPEDNGSEALSFEVNPQDRDDGATSDDEWFEETGSEVGSNEDLQNSQDPQGPDDEAAFDDESSAEDDGDGATFDEDTPNEPATQMSRSIFNLAGRKFTDDGMYKQQGLAQADTCPRTSPRILEHSKRLREDYSTAPVSEPDQKKQKKLPAVGEATTTISPKTNLNPKPKSPSKPKGKKPTVKELREAKIKATHLPVASYFSGKKN